MYRVELIPKSSTLADILTPWVNSGRKDNSKDGQFVFESADCVLCENGLIQIRVKEKDYIYNMVDFYRLKVIDLGE